MKLFILSMIILNSAFAAPIVVPSPVDHLYIPEGFDSNDTVEVVVTGSFPNTCYSRNQVEVKYSNDVIDIKVTALAPDESMQQVSFCAQMMVPFKEVVALGNLQGGLYQVRVNDKDQSRLVEALNIHESSSTAVDDNIYGAIEWVEQKANGKFLLHGTNYSPCFVLDQVKVVSNKKDTLSILPVMKQISDFCPMKGRPVTYPVQLDFSGMNIKNTLLHVRTLDGKSVNTIVDLQGQR